ncbi:hypothetical protein BD309DRAFT_90780 [Dichomitus squalens]|uniref:Uncharacterized protein n=1 Tax=Dichomitus squalens TaxID=114155 RepID=A0A4Q9NU56_9APHY|nr:hypothetical protein BD309DRAFT_90780 [Dichomitus squalens]TBU64510.1 hypothetical protein BD310DRAFT_400615 [Dichomitus squalens]
MIPSAEDHRSSLRFYLQRGLTKGTATMFHQPLPKMADRNISETTCQFISQSSPPVRIAGRRYSQIRRGSAAFPLVRAPGMNGATKLYAVLIDVDIVMLGVACYETLKLAIGCAQRPSVLIGTRNNGEERPYESAEARMVYKLSAWTSYVSGPCTAEREANIIEGFRAPIPMYHHVSDHPRARRR